MSTAAAAVGADAVGDLGGGGRGLVRVGHRGDHDHADLVGGDAGPLEGDLGGRVAAMSTTDSSCAAKRRSMMPERSRIHSSEESMRSQISALVTTRSGR